ncbi:hypothetical protein DB31_2908 [Hyalangium minutum]|uniref:Uncharacterized protein n=1 Tax=Hyalangium minutum TaxID=394096 RepID=A0A085W6K2_9BACT|nr:hypothetical protein DB31_2908 [Hyalangium minutum]
MCEHAHVFRQRNVRSPNPARALRTPQFKDAVCRLAARLPWPTDKGNEFEGLQPLVIRTPIQVFSSWCQ